MKKDIKYVSKKQSKIKLMNEKIISEQTRIEMLSNREVVVEGCGGVLEFNDTYIKLKLYKGNVIISGGNLCINGFEDKTITICGNIESVEFCIGEQGINV